MHKFLFKIFRQPSERRIFVLPKYAYSGSAEMPVYSEAKVSPAVLKQQPQNPSFVKNLLIGVFDNELLTYPEALEVEKLEHLQNQVLNLRSQISGRSSHSGIRELSLQFFKDLKKFKNLEELSSTECLRLSEVYSVSPSVALTVQIQDMVIKTLEKYGSDSQKRKFLSKSVNGELLGAFALAEEASGSDPSCIKTSVTWDKERNVWKISGQKLWVTNGSICDFFILFAKTKVENKLSNSDEITAFVIEKGSTGIVTETIEVAGLQENQFCRVNLKEVEISEENVVGGLGNGLEVAFTNCSLPKDFLCSCILENLKSSLFEVTEFIKHRKQSGIHLRDSELIKKKIAKVATTIYAFESMLYLTSGLIDKFNFDPSVETVISEVFGKERGLTAIDDCITLLGAKAYENSCTVSKFRSDLMGISLAFQSVDVQKLFISYHCIHYAGLKLNENIKKIRNPLNFPAFILKRIINNTQHIRDSPKLRLELYTNLHPALKAAADQLEYSVLRLQFAIENLLGRHGGEIMNRQIELARVSDVIIDIYAMCAVLGRASRAYCTGIRLSDEEMLLARAFCHTSSLRIRENLQCLMDGIVGTNDIMYLKLASPVFKNNGYFSEHPLTRNVN